MSKRFNKVALIFAIMLLVLNVRVHAHNSTQTHGLPIGASSGTITSTGKVHKDAFNLNDSNMNAVLDGKFDQEGYINFVEIKAPVVYQTTSEDTFFTADMLELDRGKLNHQNRYIIMNGMVRMRHMVNGNMIDERHLSTTHERDTINSVGIDYDYWNDINYNVGGDMRLSMPGYYLINVTDSSYENHKGQFLLKVTSAFESNKLTFDDVKRGNWFHDDVYESARLGIVEGVGWNKYKPHDNLTIAEALTMASRVNAKDNSEFFLPGGSKWYDNSVKYALRKGIINQGDFSNFEKIATRDEMAYIFAKTLPDNKYRIINNNVNIRDLGQSSYKDHVTKLYKSGIVIGKGGYNGFDPRANITRAEVAAIVNRIVNEDSRIRR